MPHATQPPGQPDDVPQRSRRLRRGPLVAAIAVPAGLIACGALVWQASYAAFTGSTSNAANNWQAGTVSLTNDATPATAMFDTSATPMKPGDGGSNCIAVSYGGNVASTVSFYLSGLNTTNAIGSAGSDLGQSVDITVVEGNGTSSGAGFGNCTGFVPGTTLISGETLTYAATNHDSVHPVAGSWAPAAAGQRVYKVTWTLNSNAPNDLQGKSVKVDFNWVATSS